MNRPRKAVEILLTISVILNKVLTYITAPLWQDSLKPHDTEDTVSTPVPPGENVSIPWYNSSTSISLVEQIDPFFCVLIQALTNVIFWGVILVIVKLFFPQKIGEQEKNYPMRLLVVTGISQTVSTTLINFSLSGTRTPPYLVSVLANFLVPLQFTTR